MVQLGVELDDIAKARDLDAGLRKLGAAPREGLRRGDLEWSPTAILIKQEQGLLGGVAAVDGQSDAGDVAGAVAAQPQDGLGDLLGGA